MDQNERASALRREDFRQERRSGKARAPGRFPSGRER